MQFGAIELACTNTAEDMELSGGSYRELPKRIKISQNDLTSYKHSVYKDVLDLPRERVDESKHGT